jgi:N12 class adenine-specific DNA methylase
MRIRTSLIQRFGIDLAITRSPRQKEVQPIDLLPGDISARLGSSWIPAMT